MTEYLDSITPEQYTQYSDNWVALINGGDADALQQAFQVSEGVRRNFLNFSLDQVLALVTAPDVSLIKARYLLIPDATGQSGFSVTLFAADADGQPLTDYYVPTVAEATTTQTVQPAPGPSTKILRPEAVQRLTEWVAATALTIDMFTTDSGPLLGGNFKVSTFQDPLAAASPYGTKGLFLNLGLISDPESTSDLVVYIAALGSRTQGNLDGLPSSDIFYDGVSLCPPNH